jgi:hypothetical protein
MLCSALIYTKERVPEDLSGVKAQRVREDDNLTAIC